MADNLELQKLRAVAQKSKEYTDTKVAEAGKVNDVVVDGLSVVNDNKEAIITLSSIYETKDTVSTELAKKVNKSGDTMTGKLIVPQVETGTASTSYFQSRYFRGQGDASDYRHAVDFGFSGHDKVDFYEYGATWNFWQNQSSTKVEGDNNRALTIKLNSIQHKSNTFTWPTKDGTLALAEDLSTLESQVNTNTTNIKTNADYIAAHEVAFEALSQKVDTKQDIINENNKLDVDYINTPVDVSGNHKTIAYTSDIDAEHQAMLTYIGNAYYNKSEIDTKISNLPTFETLKNYETVEAHNADITTINSTIESTKNTLQTNIDTVQSNLDTTNNNLSNNYYTSNKVDELIKDIKQDSYQVVETLPETGEAGIIYLVPTKDSSGAIEYYTKYIYEDSAYISLGTTKIDLSNYVTIDSTQAISGTKTFTSTVYSDADILPNAGETSSLGDGYHFWKNLYINNIIASKSILAPYYLEGNVKLEDKYQKILTAGDNIKIDGTTISADIDLSTYATKTDLEKKQDNLHIADEDILNLTSNELSTTYTNATEVPATIGGIDKGTTFDNMSIKTLLTKLLYPYVAPTNLKLSLVSGSSTKTKYVFVNGKETSTLNSVTISSGTYSFTHGTETPKTIEILGNNTTALTEVVSNVGSTYSGNFMYSETITSTGTNASAETTYRRIRLKYLDANGTTQYLYSGYNTYTFVHPFYYGIADLGTDLDALELSSLTPVVQNKANSSRSYTTSSQYAIYAYPATYGKLSKIIDQNNFDVTNSFTLYEKTSINGIKYYAYISNTVATATNFKYTFNF